MPKYDLNIAPNSDIFKNKADKTYVDNQDALKQNITDDSLATEDKTIVTAINELESIKTDYAYVDGISNMKQNKTDMSLTTSNKTVSGAINELVTNKTDKTYVDDELAKKESIIDWNNLSTPITIKATDHTVAHFDNETVQFYNQIGKSIIFLRDDVRFSRTNDNAVTLIYNPADGTLKYGTQAAPVEVATLDDIKNEALWTQVNTVMTMNVYGNLGMGNKKIIQLADPTSDNDGSNKKYVDHAIGSLSAYYTQEVLKLSYYLPCTITGANSRNVTVSGNLQVGAQYRIGVSWSNSPNNNIKYITYCHKNNSATNDIERYWHSGVAGLLPNVLALSNVANTGFKIYCPIGTQNTDGFIVSVDVLTTFNLNQWQPTIMFSKDNTNE